MWIFILRPGDVGCSSAQSPKLPPQRALPLFDHKNREKSAVENLENCVSIYSLSVVVSRNMNSINKFYTSLCKYIRTCMFT